MSQLSWHSKALTVTAANLGHDILLPSLSMQHALGLLVRNRWHLISDCSESICASDFHMPRLARSLHWEERSNYTNESSRGSNWLRRSARLTPLGVEPMLPCSREVVMAWPLMFLLFHANLCHLSLSFMSTTASCRGTPRVIVCRGSWMITKHF